MFSFLDVLVGVFLAWWGYLGFKRGLVEELSRLIGIVSAFLIAQKYSGQLVIALRRYIELDSSALMVASSLVLFSLVLIIVRFFSQFFHQFVVTKSSRVVDKIFGISFGVLKGSLIVVLLVWGLSISPKNEWSLIMQNSSTMIRNLVKIKDSAFRKVGVENSFDYLKDLIPQGDNETL